MKKNVVVYYSKSGNNKFLAEKTAKVLNCDLIPLKPRVKNFPLLLLSSATKLSLGNKKINTNLKDYESVILCGPIWMGQFISPLNDFVSHHMKEINKLNFITCCGSKDSTKDDKFGYNILFKNIRGKCGPKANKFEAFPIEMVLEDEEKVSDEAMMKARLSESNFDGEIKKRFNEFLIDLH